MSEKPPSAQSNMGRTLIMAIPLAIGIIVSRGVQAATDNWWIGTAAGVAAAVAIIMGVAAFERTRKPPAP